MKRILQQVLKFVLLMAAVSIIVFLLVDASPVDPVQANVGQAAYVNMSEAKRAQLAAYWGADTPVWERYAAWASSHITFEKDGTQSTLDKKFDTIMEAVEYFYNFLKTI